MAKAAAAQKIASLSAVKCAMLGIFGPRHPSTNDEHVPLDPTRMWVAALGVVVFVVCFAPVPLQIVDLSVATR